MAALNWLGWGTRIETLTRVRSSWPHMTPWTAMWLAALALAVGLQLGELSPRVVRAGRLLATGVAATTVVVLAEYVSGGSAGIDLLWFPDAVQAVQPPPWPGRPCPQTALSTGLLAMSTVVMTVDRRAAVAVWLSGLVGASLAPIISLVAYLFGAMSLVTVTKVTGQAFTTSVSLLLLVGVVVAARPDQLPLRWLMARPDRRQLTRLIVVLAAFPAAVASCRLALLACGAGERVVWTISTVSSAVLIGVLTFYLSQREQGLLIDKEMLSAQRADAERQYRLLADNAVDVVLHLRDHEIVWASPSVAAALGESHHHWVGSDIRPRIHEDDLDATVASCRAIAEGAPVAHRFRVRAGSGDYRWVDGHGKRYLDGDGRVDGVIAALRIVDGQVEMERRLERLARLDALTGLANRAEALGCLTKALARDRDCATGVGILFCDVDHFKLVNDTWGHAVGDAVLTTLADRIVSCVRTQDTVGRIGGDEIIVILPGIRSLEEVTLVAARIRQQAAKPIVAHGNVICVTISVGAATATESDCVTSILARADAAMYHAKSAGGQNPHPYRGSMNAGIEPTDSSAHPVARRAPTPL